MVKKSKKSNVNLIRNLIFGSIGLLVLGIVVFGLLQVSGSSSGTYSEGSDYIILDKAPKRRPGEPVVVREFFSYGCVHCKNFDPLIEDWKDSLPDGAKFERSPVSFNPAWTLLAQTYLALEQLDELEGNHGRLFRAIHENKRQFNGLAQIADFVAKGGVDKSAFLSAVNSSTVKRRMSRIELDMVAAGIRGVPNVVVAGKYRINMDGGRKEALAIVDHVVQLELGNTMGSAKSSGGE